MNQKKPIMGVLVCLGWALAYIVVLKICGYVSLFLDPSADMYSLTGVLAQTVSCAFIFVPLLVHKKLYVFKEKKKSTLYSIGVSGFYMFSLAAALILGLLDVIDGCAKGLVWAGWLNLICYVISMAIVGISEELMFRGVIINVLKDYFGNEKRSQMYGTVIWSGIIFGSMHIFNILSGVSPKGAIFQALGAAGVGCYFGAIYVRTGNLGFLMTIHAINDLVLDLCGGIFGQSSAIEQISGYDAKKTIGVLFYVALTMFLLRKKKTLPLLDVEQTEEVQQETI